MDNQFIVPVFLGVGVLLSVAFFGVFKAEQESVSQRAHAVLCL